MPLNVTITQGFATNEQVMGVLNGNTEALMKMLLEGIALAGAAPRKGTVAVQDSDFPGMKIEVAGIGLTWDGAGRLTGGVVDKITVISSAGATVGTIGAVGGLGIDVVALKNGVMTSVTNLVPVFGNWQISFTAETIPTGTAFFGMGAMFEAGMLNDSLTGSNFADLLLGARGNDTVRGGAGMDTLDGDDTLYLLGDDGPGKDVLFGEDGADLLRGRGGDDRMYGGTGNDTLTGDQIGETGNDLLLGGDGNDALWGGEGNDTINGGAGYDRLVQPLARSGDFTFVINLATGVMTGEGTDTLISIEGVSGAIAQRNQVIGNTAANGLSGGNLADTLIGGGGADRLFGSAGADSLAGGLGNDKIGGGVGNDVLRGNGGADHFVFTEAGAANADQIADFGGADKIDIHQSLVSFAPAGVLSAGAFKLMGTALDGDDRVIYDQATGEVWVDGDGSGTQVAQLLARVSAGTVLTATVFNVLDYDWLAA